MAEPFTLTERRALGIATIMARKDVAAVAIGEALGMSLTDGASQAGSGKLVLLGTGPGTWLALADDAPDDWADRLADTLSGIASVSDQSGGYVVFRLAGPAARTLLQRGVSIDLHPDAFARQHVAVTTIAHIGVILWPSDDENQFDVAVFRSFSTSFLDWLHAAARGVQGK